MNKAKPPILTRENWKDAVLEAIRDLPEDVQASIGHSSVSDDVMIVTVAAEPRTRWEETSLSRVEIRYWNSTREKGWPPEQDILYGPGGAAEAQVDWPFVMLENESSEFAEGFYIGRSPIGCLKGQLQIAVLEEMHAGGGMSLVCKDHKGRFIRKDGTRLLDWQFRRKPKH